MNINTSEYANRDHREGAEGSAGDSGTPGGWPALSQSELASFLYTCGLLPYPPEPGRDRGDGERS